MTNPEYFSPVQTFQSDENISLKAAQSKHYRPRRPHLQIDSSTNVGGSILPELPLTVAALTASLTSGGASGRTADYSLPRT